MATYPSLLLLLGCLSTSSSYPRSCKGRCGEAYNKGSLCQCDNECLGLNECCPDYEKFCTSKDSCNGRCGEPFRRGNTCHCDIECGSYNQCCTDYESMCLAEETSSEDMTNVEATGDEFSSSDYESELTPSEDSNDPEQKKSPDEGELKENSIVPSEASSLLSSSPSPVTSEGSTNNPLDDKSNNLQSPQEMMTSSTPLVQDNAVTAQEPSIDDQLGTTPEVDPTAEIPESTAQAEDPSADGPGSKEKAEGPSVNIPSTTASLVENPGSTPQSEDPSEENSGSSALAEDPSTERSPSTAAVQDPSIESPPSTAPVEDPSLESPLSTAPEEDPTVESSGSAAKPEDPSVENPPSTPPTEDPSVESSGGAANPETVSVENPPSTPSEDPSVEGKPTKTAPAEDPSVESSASAPTPEDPSVKNPPRIPSAEDPSVEGKPTKTAPGEDLSVESSASAATPKDPSVKNPPRIPSAEDPSVEGKPTKTAPAEDLSVEISTNAATPKDPSVENPPSTAPAEDPSVEISASAATPEDPSVKIPPSTSSVEGPSVESSPVPGKDPSAEGTTKNPIDENPNKSPSADVLISLASTERDLSAPEGTPPTSSLGKPTKIPSLSNDRNDQSETKLPSNDHISTTPSRPIEKPTPGKNDPLEDIKNYNADDHDKDLCSGRPISGLTTLRNGTTVVFRGHYFWTLDRHRNPDPPRLITQVWGIPSPIDTVYTRCNCQGKTYFFKGKNYWRFENGAMDPGFPKPISQGFGQIGHITAALSIPAYRSRKESVIFFRRGGLAQKYTYQVTPDCGRKLRIPVITLRLRARRQAAVALEQVINISRSWRGFPSQVTSAVSVPSRVKEGYKYYVFSQRKYYSIKMERDKPVILTPATGRKENSASSFFRCNETQTI